MHGARGGQKGCEYSVISLLERDGCMVPVMGTKDVNIPLSVRSRGMDACCQGWAQRAY